MELPYDKCHCGRRMTIIFGEMPLHQRTWEVYWCAGCGEVNVHYTDESDDSRYVVNPDLKGKP